MEFSRPETGVGNLSLLQGIFPIQGSTQVSHIAAWILYQLSHKGSPRILEWVGYPFCRESSQPRNQTLHPLACPLGSGGSGSFLILVFQSLGHSCNALFLNSVFQWWTQRHCYSGRSVLYCSSKHLRAWGLEIKGFPGGSAGKESTYNAGDSGLITGLGRSLEKGMATHSSILAWEIPWTMESAGYSPQGLKESDMTLRLKNNNKA